MIRADTGMSIQTKSGTGTASVLGSLVGFLGLIIVYTICVGSRF